MRATAAAALALLTACAATVPNTSQPTYAEVRNAAGDVLGRLTLESEAGGTRIRGELSGLPPGVHAFHIHAVGRCEPPSFTSAGGHFNPQQVSHGLRHAQGGHAGDLPNIIVNANGRVGIDTFARAPLEGDGGILDADGAAIMVHAGVDDLISDPAGDAGGRIACGVITR